MTSGSPGPEGDPAARPRLRVLAVDDEALNLKTFVRVFRREFEIETALSAALALDQIAASDFDVVVTDYAMPELDGLHLLARVAERSPRTRRLLATGHYELQVLADAVRDGLAELVLPKPWTREAMLRAITGPPDPTRG